MGIQLRDYNEMTPHELNLHIIEYGERVQREGENDLVTAYLTAYYHRVKRMPNLKSLIKDIQPRPRKPQSDVAMLATVKRFQAEMGKEG